MHYRRTWKSDICRRVLKRRNLLVIAQDAQANPVGFMGVENQKLEMLFIVPQAVGFYTHMGFRLARRTEIDEQGHPYPILYMKLDA